MKGPERPIVFCDICGEEETGDLDSSKLNKVEAAKAVSENSCPVTVGVSCIVFIVDASVCIHCTIILSCIQYIT